MIPHLFFYQLVLLGLLWLLFMLHAAWPSQGPATQRRPVEPILPPRKRSSDPQPFPGLTRTPPCAACAQAHAHAPSHLVARHPARSPRVAARARWTPRRTSAPIRPVPIGAGSGSAISVPMDFLPFVNFFTPSARLAHDES